MSEFPSFIGEKYKDAGTETISATLMCNMCNTTFPTSTITATPAAKKDQFHVGPEAREQNFGNLIITVFLWHQNNSSCKGGVKDFSLIDLQITKAGQPVDIDKAKVMNDLRVTAKIR